MQNGRRVLIMLIMGGLAALAWAACSFDEENEMKNSKAIKGSGIIASETRPISDVDAVRLAGTGMVHITVGESESLTIEAEDNILPVLTSDVQNGTLALSTKENTSININHDIIYTITVKKLVAVAFTGRGEMVVEGVATDYFAINVAGDGRITASGNAQSVTVELSGNGGVYAFDLAADEASVGLAGNGTVEVTAHVRLDADVSGNGVVIYAGEPEVNTSVNGNGGVRQR